MEADGFQADTEDDDEDDCVIISTQSGKLHRKIIFCKTLPFNCNFQLEGLNQDSTTSQENNSE